MRSHEPHSTGAAGLLDAVFGTFGPRALDHRLFYQHAPALRFELSGGDTPLAMFTQAFDRARAITGRTFHPSDTLIVVLTAFVHDAADVPRTRRRLTTSLRALGLERVHVSETQLMPTDEDFPRVLMAFELPGGQLPELLWGVFAQELGVRPRLGGCSAYVANVARGVLVHPYDDRGMDVVGPNEALLGALYREFQAWLLDYDRTRMQDYFEPM